jgi:hypothetical protein
MAEDNLKKVCLGILRHLSAAMTFSTNGVVRAPPEAKDSRGLI